MQLPFFIVGTGRCGTTIFRKLLAEHPGLYVPRETHWIPVLHHEFGARRVRASEIMHVVENVYMARGLSAYERIMIKHELDGDRFRSDLLDTLDHSCTIREFMDIFYAKLASMHGCTIVGDKTPDYGMCMTIVQSIWPGAKFVHLHRDGRDVAMSMSKVLSFRLLAAWRINHWWAISWQKAYEAKLAEAEGDIPIERFYELWRARVTRMFDEAERVTPGTCMHLAYEELLAAPAEALGRVATFVGLPDAADWIDRAALRVRQDNANRNAGTPEYEVLTRRFGEDLSVLGYR